MTNITVRNHFVQQEIQRKWGSEGGYPFGLRNGNMQNRIDSRFNPINEMVKKYLYTIANLSSQDPDYFEKQLTEIENQITPHLSLIEECVKTNFPLSVQQKIICYKHVVLQGSRLPATIAVYEKGFLDFFESARIEVSKEMIRFLALKTMMVGIDELTRKVSSNFDLDFIQSKNAFFLGDKPVLHYLKGEQVHPDVGFYEKADQIFLVISPTTVIQLTNKNLSGMLIQPSNENLNKDMAFQSNTILSNSKSKLIDFTDFGTLILDKFLLLPTNPPPFRIVDRITIVLDDGETKRSVTGGICFYPPIYDTQGAGPSSRYRAQVSLVEEDDS